MEDVKAAVLAGCMLGIAFAVIKNYIPDKKVYKTVRMLMSLVLTVTVILPFLNGEVEITLPTNVDVLQSESEFLSSELEKAYINQIEKKLSENLTLYLKKENIIVKKLVIETKVDEYNFLEVSKVLIETDKYNQNKVSEIVNVHLGNNIIVEFYDEN